MELQAWKSELEVENLQINYFWKRGKFQISKICAKKGEI